jgi:hypothetical protein
VCDEHHTLNPCIYLGRPGDHPLTTPLICRPVKLLKTLVLYCTDVQSSSFRSDPYFGFQSEGRYRHVFV